MADTRDPQQPDRPAEGSAGKFSENPETQTPPTPAPTAQSEVFETQEEVEEHQDKGHYNVVSDIKMGHAKVPKFLKATYVILAVWGLYYALTAAPINDRTEASPSAEPTAQAGADVFSVSCAGCHNPTTVRKIGPGLAGAYQRLGEAELTNVLHNGRPQKGMPAPPSLNLDEKQLESLKLYIQSLK
jgi:mono/diheme cytochrome c family protein